SDVCSADLAVMCPVPPIWRIQLRPGRGTGEPQLVTLCLPEREDQEIEGANAFGNPPVVFIHGLWLLPSRWDRWVQFFSEAGYAPLTPDWPDDPETVQEARATPAVLAKKTLRQVADHTT